MKIDLVLAADRITGEAHMSAEGRIMNGKIDVRRTKQAGHIGALPIVVQRARAEVEISFRVYARAGVPLTVLTLAAGIWML